MSRHAAFQTILSKAGTNATDFYRHFDSNLGAAFGSFRLAPAPILTIGDCRLDSVMFNVGIYTIGRMIFVAMILIVLNSCVFGSPIIGPMDAGLIIGSSSLSNDCSSGEPIQTKVAGTYGNGYWFDRNLYSVWVLANSSDEAKRVANSIATESCLKRRQPVKVISIIDSENSKNWLVRLGANCPSYEMKFRCEEVEAGAD